MKKLLLITMLALIDIACFGQQIDLNKQVSFKPSDKLVRISKNEAILFENEKFNDNKHESMELLGNLPTFKIDNILITLNSEKGDLKADHLTSLKKGLDHMSAKNISYHSSIDTVNNQRVLITLNSNNDDTDNYQFFCVNQANNIAVVGLLRFKPTDKAEARRVCDDLIKNMTFNE